MTFLPAADFPPPTKGAALDTGRRFFPFYFMKCVTKSAGPCLIHWEGSKMEMKRDDNLVSTWIEKALAGETDALEKLLCSVQDMVFNLSLRMLGTVPDAEDATQEILVRVMTRLSSFRGESAFSTWVYSTAVHYLLNQKKSLFSQRPLSFEIYSEDILSAQAAQVQDLPDELDREALAEELKLSCSNVMLQCLDPEDRCIFVLGAMFHMDSRIAGEMLSLTPETYRQRLSRIRKKMAGFLSCHCGLAHSDACSCRKRVPYAVSQGRLRPDSPEFKPLALLDARTLSDCKEEMEQLDALAQTFEGLPHYRSPLDAQELMQRIMRAPLFQKTPGGQGGKPCHP